MDKVTINVGDVFYNKGSMQRAWLTPMITVNHLTKMDNGDLYFFCNEKEECLHTDLLKHYYTKG